MEQVDLKRFRADKKLTQVDLADLFGCNQNFISDIENGKKPMPVDKLEILKEKYGDITAYITEKDNPMMAEGNNIIQQSGKGNNITQQQADGNTVNRFISLLEKKDEQIDRLLTIIEKLNK